VFSTDAAYKASFVTATTALAIDIDSTTPVNSDILLNNGTAWSASAGNALGFSLKGRVHGIIIKITGSSANSLLEGYGVFYGQSNTVAQYFDSKQNQFIFDGTIDNLNTFAITFNGDIQTLFVNDVETGQNWYAPSFDFANNILTFPQNFFDGRGLVHLLVKQFTGNGGDTSKANDLLMAENHLGSLDPALDKSVSGRGILIRDANGVLQELYIDGNNTIRIRAV